MTRFKAVFFDVDGTLYRSREYEENLLESAVAVVAEILKIGRSEAFRRLMTLKREVKTVSRSVEMMGINRSKFYDRLAEVASPEKFIRPSPAVAEMLRNIRRRGVVVGLHTNSGRRLALKVLSCLGVGEECYDFMVSSDDAEPKPDLSGYVVLLSKAGVKAFESLYVGDRCEVELAQAKKLGMQTALVHSESCVYADFFLEEVREVERLI